MCALTSWITFKGDNFMVVLIVLFNILAFPFRLAAVLMKMQK
nr:MAG TPA: hypothetical protein [Siphoviridae sp. ctYuc6]